MIAAYAPLWLIFSAASNKKGDQPAALLLFPE